MNVILSLRFPWSLANDDKFLESTSLSWSWEPETQDNVHFDFRYAPTSILKPQQRLSVRLLNMFWHQCAVICIDQVWRGVQERPFHGGHYRTQVQCPKDNVQAMVVPSHVPSTNHRFSIWHVIWAHGHRAEHRAFQTPQKLSILRQLARRTRYDKMVVFIMDSVCSFAACSRRSSSKKWTQRCGLSFWEYSSDFMLFMNKMVIFEFKSRIKRRKTLRRSVWECQAAYFVRIVL